MAEIKIRRKRSTAWWPLLLLLLVPLAWYLYKVRAAGEDASAVVRDTGTVPAKVPLPSAAVTHATLPPPPVASSAPPVTSTDVSTPVTGAPPTTRPVARPPAPSRP